MNQPEEHSCLLRRLNLCDGQRVRDVPPRPASEACWCSIVGAADESGQTILASVARTERARSVARSAETQRVLSQRARWTGSPTPEGPLF